MLMSPAIHKRGLSWEGVDFEPVYGTVSIIPCLSFSVIDHPVPGYSRTRPIGSKEDCHLPRYETVRPLIVAGSAGRNVIRKSRHPPQPPLPYSRPIHFGGIRKVRSD